MLAEFPSLQVPDGISRICSLNLNNSRKSYTEIFEIIESDKFLNLFIKEIFSDYIKKGGLLAMLTALGWEGIRNRIAEAYIYYARHKKFPKIVNMDEVNDVLDLERRFDFLYSELNSRVFMLGMYLKLCEIKFEEDDEFFGLEFVSIPPEVDEILILGKSKGVHPDWLIVIVWSFIQVIGHERTQEVMLASKGNMSLILDHVHSSEYEQVISCLLKYGNAIKDSQFFIAKKV